MPAAALAYTRLNLRVLHFGDARRADVLAFKVDNLVRLSAEDASWFILLQNDTIPIDIDFESILFANAERAAQLDRNHDTAQLVNLAHDTCRLHCTIPVQ